MGLLVKKEELPGYKTAKMLYDLIPGSGIVKKILVGVTVGAVIIGAIYFGAIGIAALLTFVGGSLLGSSLLTAGVVASLPVVFDFLLSAGRTAYTFNWNASDAELDKVIEDNIKNLYGVLGEAAGQAVGQFIGGVAGKAVYLINPAAAKLVTENLSEERRDEVFANMANIHRASCALLANIAVTNAFKSSRRWLKDPSSPFHAILKKHMGKNFEKWGEDGQPSFTISKYVEDKIETIPDEGTRNFVENFVEGVGEGLNETLTQMNNSLRQYMTAMAIMNKSNSNPRNVTVQLDFNRNNT